MIEFSEKHVETPMQIEPLAKSTDWFKIFLRLLYTVSLIIYAYLLYDGMDYYQEAYQARPHHEDYRSLRPAGFKGHGYGVIGSMMMLFMLFYTLRKRTKLFGNWGTLNHWLDIHIYFGVMGPLFIILHTSFKVQGLVAVSFWSMIIVALSGVLGRYLYLQIPRNNFGTELDLNEIAALNQQFNRELQAELNLHEDQMLRLETLSNVGVDENRSAISLFFLMIVHDFLKPLQYYRLRNLYAREFNLGGAQLKRAVILARRKIRLQRRILLLNQIQRLFHYWHVFHKPFAIIMYVIMFVHIGVAIWLGYAWVL